MNAHLANEVQFDLERAEAPPGALLHVIVSDGCLVAAGVPLAELARVQAPGKQLLTPHEGAPPTRFRVEVQTRYHATGECSPWRSVFAAYVPQDALSVVLAPRPPARDPIVPCAASPGGLFLSLPIVCDARGCYDPYTHAAVRVAWGSEAKCARVLMFSYDELIPPTTRYAADRIRLLRFCRHLCRYIHKLGPTAPQAAQEAAAHLSMGLQTWGPQGENVHRLLAHPVPQAPNTSTRLLTAEADDDLPVTPEEQLTTADGDDTDSTASAFSHENEEILALVQRAVRDVAKRHPVRASTSLLHPGVASGLKQGAFVHRSTSAHSKGTENADVVFSGLEPPGGGRFGRGACPEAETEDDILRDVLTLAPGHKNPRSLLEWLDRGWSAVAGGDRPEWVWSRRAVSLVLRHHYGSKGRFVVVSYANSLAWGGQRAPEPRLSPELADALTEACAREQVLKPHQLSHASQVALLERFPTLEAPFRLPHPVLLPFDIAAEVAFRARVHTACLRALGGAIRAALQGAPRIAQRLRYEFDASQQEWINRVSQRLPVLLEHTLLAIEQEPVDAFYQSAFGLAMICFLGTQCVRGRRVDLLSDDVPPDMHTTNNTYAFDYYSTSGETQRLSRRPIAVAIEGDVNQGQGKCRFVPPSSPTAPGQVCERYLPGENYAYLCIGFNRQLHALIVFPGGFAFTANVAAYLALPHQTAQAVLGRFCRNFGVRAASRPSLPPPV
ncbi:DNA packaging tegument protein UL17 [Pteropodid alphaherpesvirus 1]|uniref:DNA packaging tegument protein UL17 n=1 Tax=Pteropodid alphaherpesvirus 1 TaxID=1343901 RepID=A0A060Q594_9ALPH|nr:DNA packaging tegument protein UL17 [Pteropodid alphaherpesvirus 1]BAP00696.1 DNA packaging tegument protein UL17 [Pteropodid alphaherpesvirus 1]